jgi:hypothetical protein
LFLTSEIRQSKSAKAKHILFFFAIVEERRLALGYRAMTDALNSDTPTPITVEATVLTGELQRRSAAAWIRAFSVLTGFILLRGLLVLIARYCMGLRRTATVSLSAGVLTVREEWFLFGRQFRTATTASPVTDMRSVRLENRRRYLYLLVGFGGLSLGVWVGVQFIVDGLNAGYPFLALIGAAVVAAGVILDALLYLFVPSKNGRSRIYLQLGRWNLLITGVDGQAAERLVATATAAWRGKA